MKYEVATIIKDHIDKLELTSHQYKVLNNIMNCRTKAMGQHIKKCTKKNCNHEEIINNSCQDRNCSKCQADKQIKWKEKRLNDLLPTTYSHIVFLIPRILYILFQYNKKLCYNLHLKVINNTIKIFSRHLGYITSTETWSQQGNYRPHVHFVIPEIENGNRIKKFILKKGIINIIYKKELLKELIKEIKKGSLDLQGLDLDKVKSALKNSKNYVHVKSNIINIAQVIDYLGNNVKRIGMSDSRIKDYDGETVTFNYKDRSDGNKNKYIKLNAVLFLRRYVINIMPAKFMRIRYFGFLSNINKSKLEKLIVYLNQQKDKIESIVNKNIINNIKQFIEKINKPEICEECGIGILKFYRYIKPKYGL